MPRDPEPAPDSPARRSDPGGRDTSGHDSAGLAPPPSLAALFFGFLGIGVIAFGGVLPIARRALVEKHRWITNEEFTELLGLSQFLPGPNILNFTIVLGSRFHGIPGAASAFLGLSLVPMVIVITLGWLFDRYADIGAVSNAMAGVAAAAAGLVLAMAGHIAAPLWRNPTLRASAIAVATFLAIGVFGVRLPVVMLIVAPLSVALAWRALP